MRVISVVTHLLLVASAVAFSRYLPQVGQQRLLAASIPATTPSVSMPLPADARPKPVLGLSPPSTGLWGSSSAPKPLGPNPPSEYQLNLGRAIDTLRVDHPRLFTHPPDLSIFTEDVQLEDTTGVRLRGRPQYERAFGMLRFIKRAALQRVELTHRLVVQDKTIRMRWTCKVWMRDPNLDLMGMGNIQAKLVYLDGVSVYSLNDKGFIYRHRLENVVLRDSEEEEKLANLIFAWPGAKWPAKWPGTTVPELALPFMHSLDAALPGGIQSFSSEPTDDVNIAKHSTGGDDVGPLTGRRHGVPFASASEEPAETPMQRAARERAEMAAEAEARKRAIRDITPEEPKRALFPFNPFSSGAAPQQCESSYDCESPMVCCDLLVTSICCTGGMMIPLKQPAGRLQGALIPIPVERDPPPNGMPGPRGGGMPPGGGTPPGYPGSY